MKKLFEDLTPSELNNKLQSECQTNLFTFAFYVAASIFYKHIYDDKPTAGELKKEKEKIQLLINSYRTAYPDLANGRDIRTFLTDVKMLDLEIQQKKRKGGKNLGHKGIIATHWGEILRLRVKKPNWTLLADLYDWFWARLKSYSFYELLEPPSDLVTYFRVQHHRYKNRPTFRDRNPSSMGFYVIFGINNVWIDPTGELFKSFINALLIKEKYSAEDERRFKEILTGARKARSRIEERTAYIYYVFIVNCPDPLDNVLVSPTIIFPDLSYFILNKTCNG